MVVTCGSATVRVLSGSVTASFGSVIADLVAGTAVTVVETSPGTFDFSSSSSSGGSVVVGGLVLAPGETATGITLIRTAMGWSTPWTTAPQSVFNPGQENTDSGPPPSGTGAIGNGTGIPGDDATVPNQATHSATPAMR